MTSSACQVFDHDRMMEDVWKTPQTYGGRLDQLLVMNLKKSEYASLEDVEGRK